ncbi:autotransporter outer membrane beta-barrel domain-containing protein [uncultured Sphingomonas sp.]|uniref:autotransporter outer membrane beta-barrel domain-containing protein n=1 Tax=uncultured Sphingomonas sp. TaxID=158754 RepID=UPI0025F559FA|nr:autotransporter outer membrane beta-barrel domain-containing protein [uncultured Sphingomonas sp.]
MIGRNGMSQARQVRARALGSSAIVMATMLAGPAFAQCAPEPTVVNGTTTCSGTDADGLRVTTPGTKVVVESDATVRGSTGPAIEVRLQASQTYAALALSVDGLVDGGQNDGIGFISQASSSGYNFQALTLNVGTGGRVTGANGVSISQIGQGYVDGYVAIENSGTITGTSGIALLSTSGSVRLSSITNRASGTIGAIVGNVERLDNAGTISGGSRSAISGGGYYGGSNIVNSGTIRSNSTTATIANIGGLRSLTNSGTIENLGSGAAVGSTGGMTIFNETAGRIATAGSVAIDSADALRLTNAGTIVGNVIAGGSTYGEGSVVDSTAGRITGSLRLGAGADTLVATHDGTRLHYGIDGTIDGGGGTDTVRVRFATDGTISAPLTLPTAFERLALSAGEGATVTLDGSFAAPGTLLLSGLGMIVNRTTLSGTGAILALEDYSGRLPDIVNAGTIRSTNATGGYAIDLYGFSSTFENSGTIDATRNAIRLSGSIGLVNSGTISAADNAVYLSTSAFTNTATGVIRSSNGTALSISGSYSATGLTNAGRVEGVTGVSLGTGWLINTGTIAGTAAGVVLFGGTIDNQAGGTISGGLSAQPGGVTWFTSGNTVANAGTINGDVLLGDAQSYYGNGNRYFALPGGVLNGNLALGQGDLLVTELVGTGSGVFAGINGRVTGNNSELRLRVRADSAVTLGTAPAGFATIGYEVLKDATLTLTGSGQPVTLSGDGKVDLTADIAVTTGPAIRTVPTATYAGQTRDDSGPAITSHGTIDLTRTNANVSLVAAVLMSGGGDFTNEGTIVAADRANPYYTYNRFAAISSTYPRTAGTVTNNGRITLDGTIGITNATTIVNNGTIAQVAGGRAATAIQIDTSQTSIVNNGTIDVGGVAIFGNYASFALTNAGRIASSGDIAIATDGSYTATITNLAGGTIAGAANRMAIRTGGGLLANAGTITGTVDLGYGSYDRSYYGATYIADGGTIAGDLLFGRGSDKLVLFSTFGVSGRIDGGEGIDTLIHARRSSDSVTLDTGMLAGIGFEALGVRALGADTVVTVRSDSAFTADVNLSGDGAIVSMLTIDGNAFVDSPDRYDNGIYRPGTPLSAFTNSGIISGGFRGPVRSFTNNGTIGSLQSSPAVSIYVAEQLNFANSGTLQGEERYAPAVLLTVAGGNRIDATNSGTITGGLHAAVERFNDPNATPSTDPVAISFANSGLVTGSGVNALVSLTASAPDAAPVTITLTNSGTIEATGAGGIAAGLARYSSGNDATTDLVVTNSGAIRANGGGVTETYYDWFTGTSVANTNLAVALGAYAGPTGTVQVTNGATGTIEATGEKSVALLTTGTLDLTNAGTIRGGTGTVLDQDDQLAFYLGRPNIAGAIQSADGNDRIVNSGTIIGSIDLAAGNDRIENYGRIDGNVFLGEGDDTFLQRASAILNGTVDAGAGDDLFIVDATGGGTINGDQFVNFERFTQMGSGEVRYSGKFRLNTVGLAGGTLSVAAGQTLTSDGPVTITGSDAAETVVNDGTIGGGVSLGAGNDRVVNRGTIGGAVLLGEGDDSFVNGPNSRVAGGVDGGAGTDTYGVLLAGDRSGIGARSNFERLALEGTGTLTLALDQNFDAVTLAGNGLSATLNGFSLGNVTGSDGAEQLRVDGDVVSVALGAGDDLLALGTQLARGRYDGGAGNDALRFANAGAVTLAGTATGFEQVVLTGGALNITGTLGSAGTALSFGDGVQAVTVASGGTLAGVIDLGAGNDALRLAAGSVLNGTVAGGAGSDTTTIELAGDRSLAATALTGFEILASEGTGTLTLTGTHGYDMVDAATSLTVAGGSTLTAQVRFGSGDQRFTIAGGFAGAVDGGAGSDTLAVSGGSTTTPVAFTNVGGIEAFALSGGFATVSGSAVFGTATLSGGRLVGLAGSTMAGQFAVQRGATFGSAGTVNGNVTVAGTLSPGASPGTMTVNGNVSLASGSLSLFELTPSAQDKLVINGTLAIASGSTLQLTQSGTLRPGTSYDLITASGGITGSFNTIVKPDSLFGFVVQRTDRIQLLGQFLNDASFSPQVSRAIAYTNTVLQQQPATSPLFGALPALLTGNGASNAQAFARLTPEPYATATQTGVENALALSDIARGPGFAADRSEPGGFTFGQAIGSWYRLAADPQAGVAPARTSSYGFVGGIGYGDAGWSVGAFGGYLNSRQRIDPLAARTGIDGWVAGVQGRYASGNFGFGASIAYNGGTANTDRALPGGIASRGRYDLNSLVSDLSAHYTMAMGDWALRPRVGVTYIRTDRDRVVEAGGPFALTVAADRHVAGFADTGVGFARADASDAAFRPFVSLGVRYQLEGQRADAVAGFAGGPIALEALGAGRARAVGTIAAGLVQRVTDGLDLFSTVSAQTGRDDHREAISTGVRLRF